MSLFRLPPWFLLIFLVSHAGHAATEAVASELSSAEILKDKNKYAILEKQDDFNILRHHPIYFAYGNPLTKVQFSFKSQMIRKTPFYFAYTQILFWKLREESKPFLDATFNPEFIYSLDWLREKNFWIDVGIWEHSSNGKSGLSSRSYDQTSVRFNKVVEFDRWIFVFTTKLRYIYNYDDTNKDIIDYIGPAVFELKWIQLFEGWIDKSEFSVVFNPGGKFSDHFDKGGLQVSYSFRLGGLDIVPAFYLQYYHGYGETLINYNQSEDVFRAGFQF